MPDTNLCTVAAATEVDEPTKPLRWILCFSEPFSNSTSFFMRESPLNIDKMRDEENAFSSVSAFVANSKLFSLPMKSA